MMDNYLRLGVNIDHVATIRNARGGLDPDPVRAAEIAKSAGADGITVHLREDRRHIRDKDVEKLRAEIELPLNLEMAATPEMLSIAQRVKPNAVCFVPEKRMERTTEGGMDVMRNASSLEDYVKPLRAAGIDVSVFIEPVVSQVLAAEKIGVTAIEIHTGRYCHAPAGSGERRTELARISESATCAISNGLRCHAGHGLSFETVGPIAAIAEISELNIGHFLVGEALFRGLHGAIKEMRGLMNKARLSLSQESI
jgi:pyridoxine 5-phosphate synthase